MQPNRTSISHAIKMEAYSHQDEDAASLIEDRDRLIGSLAEAGDAIEEYLTRLYNDGGYQKMTKEAWGVFGDEHFPEMLALIDKKIELLRRNYSPQLAEAGEKLLS